MGDALSKQTSKIRLDQALVERELVESREQAQRLILAGAVWVNDQLWDKASKICPPDARVEVRAAEKYVSRGGIKLEGALTSFALRPTGARCLDLGSSTGGFTDCLLQAGAREVVAIDVGRGQLHWKLRQDPRVTVFEGVNARQLQNLAKEKFPGSFDYIVADLSFISLRLVLPEAFSLLAPTGRLIALIKPQFEAGRAEIGKGGIVRSEEVRARVVSELREWVKAYEMETVEVIPSPLPGRDGNIEFLWLLKR